MRYPWIFVFCNFQKLTIRWEVKSVVSQRVFSLWIFWEYFPRTTFLWRIWCSYSFVSKLDFHHSKNGISFFFKKMHYKLKNRKIMVFIIIFDFLEFWYLTFSKDLKNCVKLAWQKFQVEKLKPQRVIAIPTTLSFNSDHCRLIRTTLSFNSDHQLKFEKLRSIDVNSTIKLRF